jgi:hypothetical protein
LPPRDLLPVMRGTFKPPTQIEQAKGFLTKALEDGPVPVRALKEQALLASVAVRTMHRAADEIGIDKTGREGWKLPRELAEAVAKMKADKARLGEEHAETHLEADEVASILRLVP